MTEVKFGTDGIRGIANKGLTAEMAFQIGLAAGRRLGPGKKVALGRDTRASGTMLGAAVASGLCTAGVQAHALGFVPTGGISWIARTQGFDLGVVISASHNPAEDNGIKLIGSDGRKAPEELERFIEETVFTEYTDRPLGGAVGRIHSLGDQVDLYCTWLESLVPEQLHGMSIVMDCSQGAAFETAPRVFKALGANITVAFAEPDGVNINHECGATKPEVIRRLTQQQGADLGIAFDGDADRAVFSDSQGRLINGDRTMAIWAQHWRHAGRLDPPIVVGTVMSNTGFEHYLQNEGIELQRVNVGDKYVSAKIIETGAHVGGEQSGHIIFPESGPTGDGLATALHLARVLKREGKTAAQLYDSFENWPQLLVNVKVANKDGWDTDSAVKDAIQKATDKVGSNGRLNVRASGTQPMIRVMVETQDEAICQSVADDVVTALLAARGGEVYGRVNLAHDLGE